MSDVRRSPEGTRPTESRLEASKKRGCDLGSFLQKGAVAGQPLKSLLRSGGTRKLADGIESVLLAAIYRNKCRKGSPESINDSSRVVERYRCRLVIDGELLCILL